ncbi:two-component sensor histidine kinase [Bacillus sp. RO2]|jgi:two-component system sporulation sensor kinase B|uniref:ATP-binding protein n=1 Tax=Bacillus sp. RO2 TaxID=2723913 RepID=UPI00145C9D8F|nr:ATP-binding protein [Bacillus sp. RO2]NMH73435.1 two-component sensor histidine kinase [Bacillus sp. RO2]
MLAEKLLLHVLIILAPVLIYYVVSENKRFGQSPYFIGILQGLSASLCLFFAFYDYGLYWDLRYIPLVLAILYGGPKAGVIVLAAILGTRTYLGGDALAFGYVSGLVAAAIPFLMLRRFKKVKTKKKRIRFAVLVGLWPNFVMLAILIAYLVSSPTVNDGPNLLLYILLFGLIQVVGVGFASTLHEAVLERELLKQEIRRAEKLNTLGELAASIAHEVRNPLTVVKGFLQLMHREDKGNSFQYIGLVLSELARAESIINDYLNFAKPEFKKIENVDLGELLNDVKMLLNPLAVKEGIHLESYLEKNVFMETDKNQFKQALVNILKNAIEATPQDGRVYIKLFSNATGIQILIKDTGKGMTKEQVSRIGTLFYTTKDKGTGLGTTVSMRIIDTMNGKVGYSSEIGKGTEVKISFPPVRQEEQARKESVVG